MTVERFSWSSNYPNHWLSWINSVILWIFFCWLIIISIQKWKRELTWLVRCGVRSHRRRTWSRPWMWATRATTTAVPPGGSARSARWTRPATPWSPAIVQRNQKLVQRLSSRRLSRVGWKFVWDRILLHYGWVSPFLPQFSFWLLKSLSWPTWA